MLWVARNRNNSLYIWKKKPYRCSNWVWKLDKDDMSLACIEIDSSLFPNLTFDDEPVEVCIFSKEFIQEYGDACYEKGEYDADRFENYGEYGCNIIFDEYVVSKR